MPMRGHGGNLGVGHGRGKPISGGPSAHCREKRDFRIDAAAGEV